MIAFFFSYIFILFFKEKKNDRKYIDSCVFNLNQSLQISDTSSYKQCLTSSRYKIIVILLLLCGSII